MKKLRFGSFVCAFFLCLVGGRFVAMGADDDAELPVRMFTISVPRNAEELLLQRLREFADANAFAMRVGYPRSPSKEFVTVQMWRDDIKIIAVTPEEPGVLQLGFYKGDAGDYAAETSVTLARNLIAALSNIPGANIWRK